MKIIAKNFNNYDQDEALRLPVIKRILPKLKLDEESIEKGLFLQEGNRGIDEKAKYFVFINDNSKVIILTFFIDWTANGGLGRLMEYEIDIISIRFITETTTKTSWNNYSNVNINITVKTTDNIIDIAIEQARAEYGDIAIDFFNNILNNGHIEEK